MTDTRKPPGTWHAVRGLPEFRRLLELRAFSQFGDGLFQAGLASALLFNPEREADPWAIAVAFAVLFVPYSVLAPFAGALLDRWDRRLVLIGANAGRLLLMVAVGAAFVVSANDLVVLFGALIVNGFTRFVSSGLSAALPHVVPRDQVLTMNSVATATGALAVSLGAVCMLVTRSRFGSDDAGGAVVIFLSVLPIAIALVLSIRFAPHILGPDDSVRAVHGSVAYAVSTGWVHGIRTVTAVPTVTATLGGLAAHRMVFGINTLLVLVIVRHTGDHEVAGLGLGKAALFVAATGAGSFLSTVFTPAAVGRWGRYRTANGALALAAAVQLLAAGLYLPVMFGCGFVLGAAGQVVKLCVDSAMQIDVDDALRGHVFTVQDAVFWVTFVGAIAAAAALIPTDGRSVPLVLAGAVLYLLGLALHAGIGRRALPV
ncbi:MAG: MFS transporter [Mycobacterium sp.]